MKQKRKYEKPSQRIVVLQQQAHQLAGSGLNDPTDYPDGGDPLGF